MARFETERAAKEYLVERIVAQAEHEQVPLSELERKMLYFSETGWTLPNMLEVNADFERDYDNDDYEQKIARLVRNIEQENKTNPEQQETWDDAVVKLSDGDHDLLVLVNMVPVDTERTRVQKWLPDFNSQSTQAGRPSGDIFRLILVAFAVLAVMFVLFWLNDRMKN